MKVNKSKTTLATLSFAVATAFAGSALAQSQTQETGAYAGLSIGQSDASDVNCSGAGSCDKKDTAWKIFGGYQFNRYIAAEAGYTGLGKTKGSTSAGAFEVKANAWELLAVGSYPIGTSGFAPYVKAGAYRGEAKLSGDFGSAKETNNDLTYGIGVRYDIVRNFAVRAEWQRYSGLGGGSVGNDSDVDVISIGALYKF
jgi:OOP family OmpA-OmpF porin